MGEDRRAGERGDRERQEKKRKRKTKRKRRGRKAKDNEQKQIRGNKDRKNIEKDEIKWHERSKMVKA